MMIAVNESGHRIGESHQLAKYSNAQVEYILYLRDTRGRSYGEIVKMTGMPKSTVRDICTGEKRSQSIYAYRKVRVKEEK
jgi:hypothetical protein